VWESLPEEQKIVITNNGKPIALLTPISGVTLEETLSTVRRARAIYAVKRMQATSMKRRLSRLTPKGIEEEIRKARNDRTRTS
jgi:antitoxin (DNA-binding transcriptional repressor) of toxin-antitoxin stability system